MSDYFSVLPLTEPLDRDGIRRLARLACLDLHRVRWLRGYVATDGTRMLCWYQARHAESVRLVLKQQGAVVRDVWPTAVIDANDAEPCVTDRDCSVAEFEFEPSLGNEQMHSTSERVIGALHGAGHVLRQAFVSNNGARLVCVIDGSDSAAVAACLRAATVAATAVWPAVARDPQPKLFQARDDVERDTPRTRDTSDARAAAAHTSPAASETVDAVIIGAGIAGISMLERLVRMGLDVRVYERANEVGGVWFWNRYPGARVDSETYTYGLSFSDDLLREWQWQELFSAQPEIAKYLRYIVDRFDLRGHIRCGNGIVRAAFDPPSRRWLIETDAGEHIAARYLIAAAGVLSQPQLPDYPGMNEFAGASYHTARWPEAGVDLKGKRVGVVGTGASGVQVIQTIADDVAHLTVFQRTPTYCMPQRNRPLSDDDQRRIQRDWTDILAACRASGAGFIHIDDPRSGLAVSAAEREAKFETLWQQPGFAFWCGNFGDLMMNEEVNEHACEFVRRKIKVRVHDPKVAEKLLPDHPLGVKRVPLENGYYEVYNRSNVVLVDLRETPIERITRAGIRTTDKEHPLDVIVFATGFDAGTGTLTRIDIRGEGGTTLAEKWREGPKTFLGLLVSGFPNLFIVNGPHNAALLCNAGRCIEQNVDWIARVIERMRANDLTRVAATAAAEEEWTAHVYETADASVLRLMTDSWFYGANTPGKARKINIYAAGAREYREHCEDVASAGYPGLTMM
jgi:cyclohexanone monooxygenase